MKKKKKKSPIQNKQIKALYTYTIQRGRNIYWLFWYRLGDYGELMFPQINVYTYREYFQ